MGESIQIKIEEPEISYQTIEAAPKNLVEVKLIGEHSSLQPVVILENAAVKQEDSSPQKKNLKCSYCAQKFTKRNNLVSHELIHAGKKHLRYLNLKFPQRQHVVNYHQLHNGEKSNKCSSGYKKFTQRAKVVSNKRQLAKLVEMMEANLDIAKGFCTKNNAKSRWQKFAIELNSLGPPSRDWDKWLRVWTDLKFKTKKRKTENKIEINATGAEPNRLHNFTDLEKAVVDIMQINTSLNPPSRKFRLDETAGHSISNEIPSKANVFNNFPDQCNLDSTDCEQNNSKNKNNTKNQELNEQPILLLKNQSSTQTQFYNEISTLTRSIKISIANIEEYAKKTYHLKKEKKDEMFKLKKEKLELYKQNMEKKEKDRKAKLQLKMEAFELKKQMYNKIKIIK